MPTIQEILIEANLSTDQVEQIAAVVTESTDAARATLRAAHLAEVAEKDAAIGDLMRELVESKKPSDATVNTILKKIASTFKISNGAAHAIFQGGSTPDLSNALEKLESQGFDSAYTSFADNAEFFAKAKVSKADFDMLVSASMDDMDESTRVDVKVNESTLTLSKRGGFRVVLAEANGKTRTARLDAAVLAEVAKKMKSKKMSEADGDEELDATEVDEAAASKVLGESLIDRFESWAGTPMKVGRMTLKGFPADVNDSDGEYMDLDAVDKDAASGLAKALKKAGFKVSRHGPVGILVEAAAPPAGEDADDADSSIVSEAVSWERWDRSHAGDKQMKKTMAGNWMVSKDKSGIDFGKKPVEGEDYMTFNGKGKDAVKAAEAWAKKIGVETVYMAESVVAKPRRVTAKKGEGSAIGIDFDKGGTFAFTVTDEEGSSSIELTKPDSAAVRNWFGSIQESTLTAPSGDIMEEARQAAMKEAAELLEAAMAEVAPRLREMRAYSEVKGRLERIQEALVTSGVFSAPLAESALNESKVAVEQENAALRAEVAQFKEVALKAEYSSLFEAATKDLAVTTREKVTKLVEAAKPTSVKEYSELLEAAVQASKPAVNPQLDSTVLAEAKPATAMDKYVRML